MSISSIIDIAVVLIVLVSAGVSFFRGFVREVLTIFGFFGGALAAYLFGSKIAPVFAGWLGVKEGEKPEKLFDLIPYDMVATICAYASIFIAVFLLLQLISYFMSASIKAIGLGPVDRALGVIFGIARALIFLGAIYLVLGNIIPDEIREKSKTTVYIETVSNWLKGFSPDNDKAQDSATENMARDKLREIQGLGSDAAEKAQNKVDELKREADKLPAYSAEGRKNLNELIENENSQETDPALPERSSPNE